MSNRCHTCGAVMIPIWIGRGNGAPRWAVCLNCGRRLDLWKKQVLVPGVKPR